MTRRPTAADELHAMLKYRAFNVTVWLARSAEVRGFDLASQIHRSEKRGDIRAEFARRAVL
jgi:hypothetical protein